MSNPNDRPLTVGEFRAVLEAVLWGRPYWSSVDQCEKRETPPYEIRRAISTALHALATLPPPVEAEHHCAGEDFCSHGAHAPQPGAPKGLVMPYVYRTGSRHVTDNFCRADDVRALLSDCNAALAEKDAEIERAGFRLRQLEAMHKCVADQLVAIVAVLPPNPMPLPDGRVATFVDPDPARTLALLVERINAARAIWESGKGGA